LDEAVGHISHGSPEAVQGFLLNAPEASPSLSVLSERGASFPRSFMKTASVTIRLDAKLQRDLDRLCRQLGRSRSEVVRDALRRRIALLRFGRSRRAIPPLAEAQGVLTDEDVFRIVS
jgi:hypothetical protein